MAFRSRIAALIIIGITVAGAVPASAKGVEAIFVTRGTTVSAPRGFDAMCRSDATFCGMTGTTPVSTAVSAVTTVASATTAAVAGTVDPAASTFMATTAWAYAAPAVRRLIEDDALGCAATAAIKGEWRHAFSGAFDRTDAAIEPSACPAAPPPAIVPVASLPIPIPIPATTLAAVATARPDGRAQAALLRQVNVLVNSRTVQELDAKRFGRDELWMRSGTGRRAAGDCEDLAIEKRYQLIARGFDPARVSFAVVFSRSLGLHTVLVARTDQGDMVLDSATPWVRRVDKTDYSWVSIQSVSDQRRWEVAIVGRGGEIRTASTML